MEPTLDVGQRVLVNRFLYHFNDPESGDIVVFHPPAGADNGTECGVPHSPRGGLPATRPKPSRARTSSSGSSPAPGDTLSVRDGHPVVNGVEKTERALHDACGAAPACNLPKPITIPPDHYFMMGDNRGASDDSRFWGPIPRKLDHRQGLRHLLAAGPRSASSKAHKRRLARSRRLFAFDRGLGASPGRRRRRGRARLPGRAAGRRRGADRLRGSLQRRPPCPRRPARLQADEARAARGDVPGGAARREPGQRRRPLRARDRRPRPARDQHRSAVQRPGAAGAGRARRPAWSTASPCADCAVPAPRRDRRRRDERRDRRRLGDRQGDPRPLHARRRRQSTPAGASRSTSATRPPSTATRSSGSESPPCIAARSRSVAYSQLEILDWLEGALECARSRRSRPAWS